FSWPADLYAFLQRRCTVDENVGSSLILPLIKSAACNCVSGAAHVASKRGNGIHRIVIKSVRVIGSRRGIDQHTITVERVCLAATRQEKANWLRPSRRPRARAAAPAG